MRSLSDTLARMASLKGRDVPGLSRSRSDRLADLAGFGSNPGGLRARVYLPEDLPDDAALVVVLHGCTQNAAQYDSGSGWSQLADRYGFALLFPEQQQQNNPNLCFNWFSAADTRRDRGEALSIRQMIAAVCAAHSIDAARIFVTGLSAGGAMTSVMLATYPELFAGGAIIAGLPFGSAATMPQAFDAMRGHGLPDELALTALVRGASAHPGPWPTISIWHGSGDSTVNPVNASAIVDQWRTLHGVGRVPTRTEAVDGYPRRVWCDARGREVIEEYSITGMGHGTPLGARGDDGCGQSGPYMLEANISSTQHICRFWGIANAVARVAPAPAVVVASDAEAETLTVAADPVAPPPPPKIAAMPVIGPAAGVGKVIEDALRAAGLMR